MMQSCGKASKILVAKREIMKKYSFDLKFIKSSSNYIYICFENVTVVGYIVLTHILLIHVIDTLLADGTEQSLLIDSKYSIVKWV